MTSIAPVVTLSPREYDAVVFDLDGVLTRTASVHAAAWKRLCDGLLEQRAADTGEAFVPFDIDADYRRSVDGKPRYDGAASFLESRGIALPCGTPEDGPGTCTMHAMVVYGYVTDNSGVGECGKMSLFHPCGRGTSSWRRTRCFTNSSWHVMHSFGRHLDQPFHGGLTPSKVQRTTASIQAHLEHALSLVELAAVTPTSPTHFAHLFKQATGQTPHQYVFRCRMERAKHLLTGTTLPLHEIGARIGYADHSHFTALLRQYVAPPQGVPRRHIQGVSAPPARFAHDSHIGRKNVTDGGGRLRYSSPE